MIRWPTATRLLAGAALSAASALLVLPAAAHDVWLLPRTDGAARVGGLVPVELYQGHAGDAEPLARNERKLERLEAIAPDGSRLDLPGRHASRPAGVFRPTSPGWWCVVYQGNSSLYSLSADRFEAYAREEGLDHVVEHRRRSATADSDGREWVSRSLKALVDVADAGADATAGVPGSPVDRLHGLEAELVLERVDTEGADGDRVELRLHVDGRPAPDVLVDLVRLDAAPGDRSPRQLQARTGAHGEVSFARTSGSWFSGPWMAAAVIARPDPSPEAEWRTHFTTLTFTPRSRSPRALAPGDARPGQELP